MSPEIDEAWIREHPEHLTGVSAAPLESGKETIISERGGEEGKRAAAEDMKKSFEEAGVSARILEFASDSLKGYSVEATLEVSFTYTNHDK